MVTHYCFFSGGRPDIIIELFLKSYLEYVINKNGNSVVVFGNKTKYRLFSFNIIMNKLCTTRKFKYLYWSLVSKNKRKYKRGSLVSLLKMFIILQSAYSYFIILEHNKRLCIKNNTIVKMFFKNELTLPLLAVAPRTPKKT